MASNNHFGLTLDTVAPDGTIALASGQSQYAQAAISFALDPKDASYMCCWWTKTSKATALPTTPSWVAAATSASATPSENGMFYYNVVFMDDVNNRSSIKSAGPIYYDTVAPVVSNVTLSDKTSGSTTITDEREVNIKFKASDPVPTSGLKDFKLSGDCTATSWAALPDVDADGYYNTTVTLTAGDGLKTVTVTVRDNALKEGSAYNTITLDMTKLTNTLTVTGAGTKHSGENLNGHWVNEKDITITMEVNATDWVGYKLWGGFNTTSAGSSTGTSEPADYTTVTAEQATAKKITLTGRYLTTGDNDKTISFTTIDKAGNVTGPTTVTVKADYSVPTVSVASNKAIVSEVSNYNSAVITPTVNADRAGMLADHAEFTWYLNNTALTDAQITGTATAKKTAPAAITIPATLMVSGDNTVKLTIVDSAGNTATSTEVTVKKDVAAPTGKINVNTWYNGAAESGDTTFSKWGEETFTTTIADSPAGLESYKAWVSATATDSTAKGVAVDNISNSFSIPHGNIDVTSIASAVDGTARYLHVQVTDKVGNSTVIHSDAFGIDTTAPTGNSLKFNYATGMSAYKAASEGNITITTNANVSGNYQVKVWGDVAGATTESAASWQAWPSNGTMGITLTDSSGIKTVYVKVKDAAHNVTDAFSATCELDKKAPYAEFWAYNADNTAQIATQTPQRAFYIRLSGNEDGGSTASADNLSYKIWGDFNSDSTGSSTATTEPANYTAVGSWNTNKPTSAAGTKDALLVGPLYFTDPDGDKTVNIRVQDNAGNTFLVTHKVTNFDTSKPEVNVTDLDHNRISKIHEYRQAGEEGAAAKGNASKAAHSTPHYADEVKYKITPSEPIMAWKTEVVVGTEKVQIGTAEGSSNMSGSSHDTSAIDCMIRGGDLEIALGGTGAADTHGEKDGTYVVVVSVQDNAGQWSEYGTLTL